MMSSAVPNILLKTNDKLDDVIAPAIGTLEDFPDFSFDSTRDKLDSNLLIETDGTVEEDLLTDSSHTMVAETVPIVDMMLEDILEIPLKMKGKSEAIAPAIRMLEDSSDFVFGSIRDELENDPIIETKGTLEEEPFIDSSYMSEAYTDPVVDMLPEDILDIPTIKETTVLIKKVGMLESSMPVVVLENKTDRLIAAKESTVLKQEMGEETGFFFAKTLHKSAVKRQIKG